MAQAYLGNTVLNQLWLGNTQISSVVTSSLFLDQYPGAQAAYSVRRLKGAYNGPLMTVRRSNDNATANIGFDINGNLDITSLTSFVGGNSGFVQTWYDQSGNDYHLVQNTNGFQANIVNSGSVRIPLAGGPVPPTKPGIFFSVDPLPAVSSFYQFYQVPFDSTISQPYSWFTVNAPLAAGPVGGTDRVMVSGITNNSKLFGNTISGTPQAFAGSTLNLGYVFSFNRINSAIFEGGDSQLGIDFYSSGYISDLLTGSLGTNSLDGISLSLSGSGASRSNYFGFISELVLYPANKSGDRQSIVNAQNNYFGVF